MNTLKEDFFDRTWFEQHDLSGYDLLEEMQQAYDEDFFIILGSSSISEAEDKLNDFWNILDLNGCEIPNTYYFFTGEDLRTVGKLNTDLKDTDCVVVFSRYDKNLNPLNPSALRSSLIAQDLVTKKDHIKSFTTFINKYIDKNSESPIPLYSNDDLDEEDDE